MLGKIKKFLIRKKNKWVLFANYHCVDRDYIVYVRKNHKTGILKFKVRRIPRRGTFSETVLPIGIIDVKKVWDELIKEKLEDVITD